MNSILGARLNSRAPSSFSGLAPKIRSLYGVFKSDLPPIDRLVLLVATLLPLAWIPVFLDGATPRIALALLLLPVGVVCMVRQAIGGELASRLALALIGSALLSSLLSPAPFNSLLGSVFNWTGTVGLATALGWWACGRHMSELGRSWLLPALTVGAIWNAGLALIQVAFDIDSIAMHPFPGRGSGSMQNPVYYGTFMAGVTACWLARRATTRRSTMLLLMLAFGVGLSGGRAAVGATVIVAMWALAAKATRRPAALNLATTVVGLGLSNWVVSQVLGDQAVTERLANHGGLGLRVAIWEMGVRAVADRPWLGWGLGNIEIGTERQIDLAYTREQLAADDTLVRWIDLHNVILNILVACGAVGLLIAGAFVLFACRSVGLSPLLVGACAIVANWMLEPVTIHTMPIALLMFGAAATHQRAAAPADPGSEALSRELLRERFTGVESGAVALGVLLSVFLLASTFMVQYGISSGRLEVARISATFGYRDAYIDDELSLAYKRQVVVHPERRDAYFARAKQFAERSASTYPVVYSVEQLGEIEYYSSGGEAARIIENRALELQPWHPGVNYRLLFLAREFEDEQDFDRVMSTLCEIGVSFCDPAASIDDP